MDYLKKRKLDKKKQLFMHIKHKEMKLRNSLENKIEKIEDNIISTKNDIRILKIKYDKVTNELNNILLKLDVAITDIKNKKERLILNQMSETLLKYDIKLKTLEEKILELETQKSLLLNKLAEINYLYNEQNTDLNSKLNENEKILKNLRKIKLSRVLKITSGKYTPVLPSIYEDVDGGGYYIKSPVRKSKRRSVKRKSVRKSKRRSVKRKSVRKSKRRSVKRKSVKNN